MKTKHAPLMLILLAAFFAAAALLPRHCAAQGRPDRVVIKGEVLVDDAVRNGSLEVVELDQRTCVPLLVHPDGRFELVLAAGTKARLRFEKDGYITKEVLVDTDNANITPEARRKNKLLRFAVQMVPDCPGRSLAYAAPVGHISFLKGSGLMKVEYDRRLVPNQGQDQMLAHQR